MDPIGGTTEPRRAWASEIHAVLKAHGLRPNKRLGQNFLISEHVAEKIMEAAQLSPQVTVCEIGCGAGLLTREIARRARRVVALELDRGLAVAARTVCAEHSGVVIQSVDALEADVPNLVGEPCVIIGNLPYYVTTPLLAKMVEWKWDGGLAVETAVVMVQREVADRMMAGPGTKTYGAFSVFMQYWATMKKVCPVPAGAFFPAPDVGSVVLRVLFRARPAVSVKDVDLFFELTRTAFGQRRKMLRQALKPLWARKGWAGDPVDVCRAAGVQPEARAEELGLEAFAELTRAVERLQAGSNP